MLCSVVALCCDELCCAMVMPSDRAVCACVCGVMLITDDAVVAEPDHPRSAVLVLGTVACGDGE